MSENKSIFSSWKFWAILIAIPVMVIVMTKMEPLGPPSLTDSEKKLIESKESFYSQCVKAIEYYKTSWKTDEYNKWVEACEKWKVAIQK